MCKTFFKSKLRSINKTKRYLKFFQTKWLAYAVIVLSLLGFIFIHNVYIKLVLSSCAITFIFLLNKTLISSSKTPLVRTPKIKRLFLICFSILLLVCLIPYAYIFIGLLYLAIPPFANGINFYDKQKNKEFILQAQNKLKHSQCKVIAITGSNGKTSVKNILFEILNIKYKTQCTPSSFNTPLGISKFINNELNFNTEFLILEYGARHKKDVLDLCKLFGADYGIITCINPQHLETFKNVDNIRKAKGELANFLGNKLCIFNLDNNHTKQLFIEKQGLKQSVSILSGADIYAKNIKIINGRTEFDICFNDSLTHLTTNLLGKHNVTNILLASSLALELGIDINSIAKIVENLKPTPHRLELIKTHINILDDSYNCSIESAKEALWVLKKFTGKKMVVTPGIIEGGKDQYYINYKLGKMCAFCDYVIIIGNTNKKAILDGLKSLEITRKNIFLCPNLEQAKRYFTLLNSGDTLLLLNDLPDDYN